MANVKSIYITGRVPADLHESESGKNLLAYFASPVSGLRISYGNVQLIPNNEHYQKRKDKTPMMVELGPSSNGQTSMYDFIIEGQDSFSWDAIKRMVQTIRDNGGEVYINNCIDPEDQF